MTPSPSEVVDDAYQLISELDCALAAVYSNADVDFPVDEAARDSQGIGAWNAAVSEVRTVALVILGRDSCWELPGPRASSGLPRGRDEGPHGLPRPALSDGPARH